MESSAPKRRKTSPSSSVPVESTTPPDAPPTQQDQQPQSSPSRSAQRPSFASPTKSSLARHNPDVLARTQEASASRRRLRSDDDLPASQPNLDDDDGAEVASALTAQLEHHSEGDGTASSPAAELPAAQTRSPSDPAPARSDVQRSTSRRIGGNIFGVQPPRRTPTRPQPRPLPPPGPENEEDILNPFGGRGLHRSPLLNTGVLPAVVQQEPELPPTPEHPDPVVSTPPSGIHNTPSKRRRSEGERRLQSSPSRHPLAQELAPELAPERARKKSPERSPQKISQKAKGKRRALAAVEPFSQAQPAPQAERPQSEKPKSEFAPGTHPRRSVRLRGPDWEKRQERDALMRQVMQLETDLELATETNREAARGASSSSDNVALLDLLRRHLLSGGKEPEPDPSAEWLETVTNPIAMLGFNGSLTAKLPPFLPQEGVEKKPEQKPISHHPIPMTASEELPYLQVFSPLTYTSTVATIPPSADEPEQPTFQKHTISVHSAVPLGLFAARIEMVVNMRSLAVVSLSVPRLDPAAIDELQPFLDSITSIQGPYHPALTRNVSVACWALSEWYRVALKRAKFWHALEKQLGPESDKSGLVELGQALRERKKRRYRKKGRDTDAETNSSSAQDAPGGSDVMVASSSALAPHMGRTAMDFEVPVLADGGAVSELRVTWKVDFDWTGEARNKLGVEVGVPGKCEFVCGICPSVHHNTDLREQGTRWINGRVSLGYPSCLTSSSRAARTLWQLSEGLQCCWPVSWEPERALCTSIWMNNVRFRAGRGVDCTPTSSPGSKPLFEVAWIAV